MVSNRPPARRPALRSAALRVLRSSFVAGLTLVGAALGTFGAPAAGAQVTTLDEGSFTVTRGGARVGREEFRIVRQPAAGGVAYSARALGAYGERRVSPALQADAAGTPLRYQVEVRRGGALEVRLTGQMEGGGHFVTQATAGGGEASREYRVAAGTVTLDPEVYHQYFALALGGRADTAASFAVLAPRHNEVGTLRVVSRERDRVALAGAQAPLDALHLVLADARGARREVWLDRGGRVLQVALPADGVVALRDEPPR